MNYVKGPRITISACKPIFLRSIFAAMSIAQEKPNACLFPDHEVSSVLEVHRCRTGHLMSCQSYQYYWLYMYMLADCSTTEFWAQLAALSILLATSSNASHCRYSTIWIIFVLLMAEVISCLCAGQVFISTSMAHFFSVVSVARHRFMTIADLAISYNLPVVVLLHAKTWMTMAYYWVRGFHSVAHVDDIGT